MDHSGPLRQVEPRIDAQRRRATTALSLPPDLLEQSCRRVGILALVLTGLWALGLAMAYALPSLGLHARLNPDTTWPLTGIVIMGLGLVISALLFVAARRLRHRPRVLLDLSLVFEVVLALLVGLLHFWTGAPPGGLSPLILIILIFPLIAPNATLKVLAASLLTASMDPVGLGVALLRGVEVTPAPGSVAWGFVPTYAMALVAVVPAGIIRRLGREVREARDLGSYRLGDRIGSGGMGDVFHAEHRLLARPAAIKLIRPALLGAVGPKRAPVVLERFRREAQATAMLRSPHTINLYDFGVAEDGTFYLVMELLDGIGLDELVTRFGPQPAERAAYLVAQACASLAEAHHRGMIHRDVKPSNLSATRNGLEVDFVKVLDFGLVKDGGGEPALVTAPDVTAGTPAYMAPELALGEPADGRADVYGLGCVLSWLVTGRLVFEASTAAKMMHMHVSVPPTAPSSRTELEVPPEFDAVVLACLAKDPAQRPASAEELALRLRAIPFAAPWTVERARRWWTAHAPDPCVRGPCDKARLAPVRSAA